MVSETKEYDMIEDLLSSNPHEPIPRGVVLLFRNEVKSEFRTVSTEFGLVRAEMKELRTEIADIKVEIADIKVRLSSLESRMDRVERSLEIVAQQVAHHTVLLQQILERLPPLQRS